MRDVGIEIFFVSRYERDLGGSPRKAGLRDDSAVTKTGYFTYHLRLMNKLEALHQMRFGITRLALVLDLVVVLEKTALRGCSLSTEGMNVIDSI